MLRIRTAIATLVVAATAVTGCSASDPDPGTVKITFVDQFSTTHPIGKGGAQPFLKYLEEHGPDVGLDIEYFAAGQLGKPKDALHLLRSGAADITPIIPAYLANELPLSSVGELPGLVTDPCAATEALMPMTQEGGVLYEEELERNGALPLWGVMISSYDVFTTEKAIRRPDDLHGMLIRSTGGVGDRVVRDLGAAPVSISAPDLYEAASRQTVSGAVMPQLSIPTYSLQEVLKYATHGANLSASTVLYAIGSDLWKTLNTEQRQVLQDASHLGQTSGCTELKKSTEAATKSTREAGVEMIEIEGSDKKLWVDALAPIREEWVRDLTSVDLPAATVLAEFEQRLNREKK